MTDIFDTKIICKKCGIEMKPCVVDKSGFQVRAVKCSKCHDQVFHPADLNGFEHFNNLRGKTFNVKLRMVGNSHTVSIPKEIVDFVSEQRKQVNTHMDNMVRLCLEDFRRLSLMFDEDDEEN